MRIHNINTQHSTCRNQSCSVSNFNDEFFRYSHVKKLNYQNTIYIGQFFPLCVFPNKYILITYKSRYLCTEVPEQVMHFILIILILILVNLMSGFGMPFFSEKIIFISQKSNNNFPSFLYSIKEILKKWLGFDILCKANERIHCKMSREIILSKL